MCPWRQLFSNEDRGDDPVNLSDVAMPTQYLTDDPSQDREHRAIRALMENPGLREMIFQPLGLGDFVKKIAYER